jgi:hypothetical protein
LIRAREEAYFPSHRFWVRRAVSDGASVIVRLRLVEYPSVIRLEVASSDRAYAEKVLTEIRDLSVAQSIYRGQAIDVSLAAGVKDEYGNVDQSGKVKVEFSKLPSPPRSHSAHLRRGFCGDSRVPGGVTAATLHGLNGDRRGDESGPDLSHGSRPGQLRLRGFS